MTNEQLIEEFYYWAASVGKLNELHDLVYEKLKNKSCKEYIECLERSVIQLKKEIENSVEQLA